MDAYRREKQKQTERIESLLSSRMKNNHQIIITSANRSSMPTSTEKMVEYSSRS